MRIKRIIYLMLLCFSTQTILAATIPVYREHPSLPSANKTPGLRDVIAKKLNVIQKVALRIIRNKLAKSATNQVITDKQRKQANWAMILGIASLVLLITPAGFLALPAAIVGLILGIKSVDGNSNTQGIIGIITSSLTLFLFLLAILIFVLFIGFAFR